ncbi:MAG: hypothetical protein JXA25_01555 [Anaerolineales bacterium]|nr:hypothetical protein [Anaerolineales bacterium]
MERDQTTSYSQNLSIDPAKITWISGTVAAVLVLISAVMQLLYFLGDHTNMFGLLPYFDVDQERNIPTFYAVALLLFAALLLSLITALEKKQKAYRSWMWGVLAAGFLLLAMDELVSIHEKLIAPMRNFLGMEKLGIFYYGWIVPGLIIILAAGFFFLRFWLRLPKKTRNRFAIAAVVYVGGAIFMEMVGGSYAEKNGNENLIFNMLATVEESLELAGVILFIHTLFGYIADTYGEIRFRLVEGGRMGSNTS